VERQGCYDYFSCAFYWTYFRLWTFT